jgi:intraflagellar transport protein 172
LKQGDYETACEIFKETNDWKNCLDKAREKSSELLNRYLNEYIKITVEGGNFAAASQAYADYGMQLNPKNFPTYKMISMEIFVECEHKEIEPLRKALYDFYKLLEGTSDANNPVVQEFNKFLTIAHLANLKFIYESRPGAQKLLYKLCISLLRYCEFVRLDKLFYEAGIHCQKEVTF